MVSSVAGLRLFLAGQVSMSVPGGNGAGNLLSNWKTLAANVSCIEQGKGQGLCIGTKFKLPRLCYQ